MIERPIINFFSKFIRLLLCMKGCIDNLISGVWFCFGEVTVGVWWRECKRACTLNLHVLQ